MPFADVLQGLCRALLLAGAASHMALTPTWLQVVAGTNYHVLLEVNFCRSGAATSGKSLLTLEAVVFEPLPYLNEDLTVLGVNCTSCKVDR